VGCSGQDASNEAKGYDWAGALHEKTGRDACPAINVDCNTASTKVDSQNFGNYNPNGLS